MKNGFWKKYNIVYNIGANPLTKVLKFSQAHLILVLLPPSSSSRRDNLPTHQKLKVGSGEKEIKLVALKISLSCSYGLIYFTSAS
jgi:hypothetical protein